MCRHNMIYHYKCRWLIYILYIYIHINTCCVRTQPILSLRCMFWACIDRNFPNSAAAKLDGQTGAKRFLRSATLIPWNHRHQRMPTNCRATTKTHSWQNINNFNMLPSQTNRNKISQIQKCGQTHTIFDFFVKTYCHTKLHANQLLSQCISHLTVSCLR